MPLPTPILDDRTFEQLRAELVARIPAFAPEWTDHNEGDPGIALLELFAFLGENLLFRFNQIPEATRLAFLKLLQIPLKPGNPASALVQVRLKSPEPLGVLVPRGSTARAGSITFETQDEVHAWPAKAVALARVETAAPEAHTEKGL